MDRKINCIAFVGSSSVYGQKDTEGGYVNRVREWIDEHNVEIEIYNLGVPGESTDDILNRLSAEIAHREPDLVVLHIGTNDTAHHTKNGKNDVDLETFEINAKKLITVSQQHSSDVLILTPTPINERKNPHLYDTYYYNNDIKKYTRCLINLCRELDIPYIDLFSKFSSILLRGYLDEDGLHLNEKGHSHVAQWVREYIRKTYMV